MRSVRCLFAGDKKRRGQDKRRNEKKTAAGIVQQKLNYAPESTIIRMRFSRGAESAAFYTAQLAVKVR